MEKRVINRPRANNKIKNKTLTLNNNHMRNLRMYVVVSENCPLCKPTLEELGETIANVPVYPIWINANSDRAKLLNARSTPHVAIVEAKDTNNNGIAEEIEETPLFSIATKVTPETRHFLIDVIQKLKNNEDLVTPIE